MPTSSTVVLRATLEKARSQSAPQMSDSDFFELFCSEQLLKSHDLSYDEIEAGIVAGGDDGGIDSAYAFVNGELVADDFDVSAYKQDVAVDLVIITATTAPSFAEEAIDKLRMTTADLLDLSKNMADLASTYNSPLRTAMGNFRKAMMSLSDRFPQIRVQCYYVSHGDSGKIHAKVRVRAGDLSAQIEKLLPNSKCTVEFLGGSELLELARWSPVGPVKLPLAQNAIATDTGFICLVRLSDYYQFVTDKSGQLNRPMLDANVRDYQGDVEVNKAIRETLHTAADAAQEFWALNNGVTVVASHGAITGGMLTLKDPRVVNGLQTSVEIFKYFHAYPGQLACEHRTILVRVALTEDERYRDRVIKATNSQTAIQPASLRATESIHKDIEDYFGTHDLFYDRRKNYYKNQGKPKDQIVTIQHLAQAVMAILLGEPDNSRARPSSLLKRDDDYARIFSEKHPIGMYVTCARIMRRVDDFLRSPQAAASQDEKTNLRFYVGAWTARTLTGSSAIQPADLDGLDVAPLSEETLAETLADLREKLQTFTAGSGVPADQAAKSPQFRGYALPDAGGGDG